MTRKKTGLRRDRESAVCDQWNQHLSGRDLHHSSGLRNRPRLRRERKIGSAVHRFRRAFCARDRARKQDAFDLPKRWEERKNQLSLGTKFTFVCDADIIGGSSGSPVVNQAGQFVGIIFDGNIQSLVLDYVFDDKQARASLSRFGGHSRGVAQDLRCRSACR